jgi:hypothetical protein
MSESPGCEQNNASCKFSSDTFVRQPQLVVLALSEPTKGSDHPNLSLENLQEEFFDRYGKSYRSELVRQPL